MTWHLEWSYKIRGFFFLLNWAFENFIFMMSHKFNDYCINLVKRKYLGVNSFILSVFFKVGIILHYSTLATVLWLGVTSRNIYKQVTKKAKRCQDPDEPPPPPRPMLRWVVFFPRFLVSHLLRLDSDQKMLWVTALVFSPGL